MLFIITFNCVKEIYVRRRRASRFIDQQFIYYDLETKCEILISFIYKEIYNL